MHCAILPVLHIWGNWGHSAGSDALWPLCGHLWPTAVHGHHVPKSLHGVGDLCYLNATVCSVIHLCLALQIPSYRSNVINHFFCDLPPLLSLACSNVTVNQLVLYIVAAFNEVITIVVILTSYLFILIIILRMPSVDKRCKAFPPVLPTSLPSSSFTVQSFSFIAGANLATAWALTKWPRCSTL